MDPLFSILLVVVVFALLAYGAYWICTKFQMPRPVMWFCGAVLLLIIFLWATGRLPMFPFSHIQR